MAAMSIPGIIMLAKEITFLLLPIAFYGSSVIAQATTQPLADQTAFSPQNAIFNTAVKVESLDARMSRLEQKVDEIKPAPWWQPATLLGGITLATVTTGGLFIYRRLNKLVLKKAKEEVEQARKELDDAKSEMNAKADALLKQADDRFTAKTLELTKTSEELVKEFADSRLRDVLQTDMPSLVHLLYLVERNSYDDVLREYFPEPRNLSSLMQQSFLQRSKVIHSLIKCSERKPVYDELALDAAVRTAEAIQTPSAQKLAISTALLLADWKTGAKTYERYSEGRPDSCDSELCSQAFTCYRRMRNWEKANQLIPKLDLDNLNTLATVTGYRRDIGNFEEANNVATPKEAMLVSNPQRRRPHGWRRFCASYIALQVDRKQPRIAVPLAKMALDDGHRGEPVLACTLLALHLPTNDPDRLVLLSRVQAGIEQIEDDFTRVRVKALMLEPTEPDKATQMLQNLLKERTASEHHKRSRDLYFLRCALAETRIRHGDYAHAIEVLMPLDRSDENGEANYLLAQAYAVTEQIQFAKVQIELARQALPKWPKKALMNERIRQNSIVYQWLVDQYNRHLM